MPNVKALFRGCTSDANASYSVNSHWVYLSGYNGNRAAGGGTNGNQPGFSMAHGCSIYKDENTNNPINREFLKTNVTYRDVTTKSISIARYLKCF